MVHSIDSGDKGGVGEGKGERVEKGEKKNASLDKYAHKEKINCDVTEF
jgi:hypothetical protein